jgi:hypothetical protein
MEKIPHLRERTDRLLRVIENDMLSKLDHEPDQLDRDMIKELAKLAFGIRWDAQFGVSESTWEAEALLHEGLFALGLHKVITVASKSLEYTAWGRA